MVLAVLGGRGDAGDGGGFGGDFGKIFDGAVGEIDEGFGVNAHPEGEDRADGQGNTRKA